MKKKILMFALCLVLIITNCIYAFASDDSFPSNGFATDKKYTSVSELWEYICSENNITNSGYVVYYRNFGGRFGLEYNVFDDDCILVRTDYSDTIYSWRVYKYDGEKMVQDYFYGQSLYDTSLVYLSNYDDNLWYVNTCKNIGISWDGATSAYEISEGIPIATSVENALLYYQTMDYSYLENASDFIEVPTPTVVSMYKASEENRYYIYYENGVTDFKYDIYTFLDFEFKYQDAQGYSREICEPYTEQYSFMLRNQTFFDSSLLDSYDSSSMNVYVYNGANIGTETEPNWIYSNMVNLSRPLWWGQEYSIDYQTYDGDALDGLEHCIITDYSTKNDAFTGSTPVDVTSSIPSVSQGDYSFLGGIFNGFGLLGNNGLIALLGHTFSYIPSEIFTLLALGVSAMLVIALFKLLVK